jgi:hypothetical protein
MRCAIIACTVALASLFGGIASAQERSTQPRYVYIADEGQSTSYWPSLKMPNLWPTGLGTRIAAGTRSSFNTVRTGTSRAWYSTQYTLAPWSKPKPAALTGSRGMTSSKAAKAKSSESGSWWPKLDFWNTEEEKPMRNVGDWQSMSSPAAGFDD